MLPPPSRYNGHHNTTAIRKCTSHDIYNIIHSSELKTQNLESNNFIISIEIWETSTKTKLIVTRTDATQRYCLDHLVF